jgi:hypothetical protein
MLLPSTPLFRGAFASIEEVLIIANTYCEGNKHA